MDRIISTPLTRHSKNILVEKNMRPILCGFGFLTAASFFFSVTFGYASQPSPPDIWRDYNPDAGDFKEEIISEQTSNGIYSKDAYISGYINGEEVRIFCRYSVKAGAKQAPGLLNVHGWMGGPAIDTAYVNDGWAVLSHDYSGIKRTHFTQYPEALGHGHMDPKTTGYKLIYDRMPDGSQLNDPKATSHYLWNAIQRRAVSYLLAQKEVDPSRIGAKGFSYGGTIMWNLATDQRIKAVVAYFGIGWITYYRNHAVWLYNNPYQAPDQTPGEKLFLSAIAPQAHAPHITAACLWLNGSNDHHGGHERGCETFKAFRSGVPWDFAIQARGHHNTEKLGDDCKLWLEKHVLNKDIFWPARPESRIRLDSDGVAEMCLTPASQGRIKKIEVYQCLKAANNIARHWRDVEAIRVGHTWIAKLPVLNVDDYVFTYANIHYDNNCVISSDFEAVIPSTLGAARATDQQTDLISEGTGHWTNVAPAEGMGSIQGFRPLNKRLGTSTPQFADPKWQAPKNAVLSFRFYCTQPQQLLLEADRQFVADLSITASDDWQTLHIQSDQLSHKAHGFALKQWSTITTLAIKPKPGADITKVIFAGFKWSVPSPLTQKKAGPDEPGRVYLAPDMADHIETFWRATTDTSIEGKELISISGKTFTRGLGVHADSRISFALGGNYKSLHVVPGPDDAHRGVLEMKILVDDVEVFSTGKVTSTTYQAKPLDLPLRGAKALTLIVTDGGDGRGGDHASWGDAYLRK